MAVNGIPQYPINTRPQNLSMGVASAAIPVLRIPAMSTAAAISRAKSIGQYKTTFGGMLKQALSPFALLKSTLIGGVISFGVAGISNFMALRQGNLTQNQFLANTVADGLAYMAAGTIGSVVGGVLGSLIPIPFIGTALGIGAGALLGGLIGKMYDEQVSPQFRQQVEAQLFSQ